MKKKLIGLSLVVLTSSFLFADGKKVEPISEAEKKEIMSENVFTLPSAGALANHLQHSLGKIDWSKFMSFKTQDIAKLSLEKRVLHLGAKGADAYFLAIANDNAHLNSVSKNINNTLNMISLKKRPLSKRVGKGNLKKLETSIKAKKWAVVLDQITKLKDKIGQEFIATKQKDLKILNDVGGWLEGYRLSVEGFNTNFKAKTTDVLVQDDLIKYLLKEMKSVKSFTEKKDIIKILTDINGVLAKATKDYKLSKKQVAELSKILANTSSIL